MALGASFWSTDWADIRVEHDFSSMSHTPANLGTAGTYSWWSETISLLYKIRQLNAAGDNTLNSKNHGRFYLVDDATSPTDFRDINYVYMSGRMVSDPNLYQGIYPAPTGNSAAYPFPPCADPTGTSTCTVVLYYQRPASGGAFYDLMHFQPYTYYGSPAEVIASILMHMGGDDSYIDTDSFSDADDGQAAMTAEPMVLVTREVGETVADTIKRVARHSNDILCVNMAGKIAMVSRTSPPAGPTMVTTSDIIGKAEWRYAREYVVNKAMTSFGEWVLYWGSRTNYPTDGSFTYSARFDRAADFDTARVLLGEEEDTTSAAKYGEVVLSNGTRQFQAVDEGGRVLDGEYVKRPAYNFPYFFDQDCRDAVMERLTDVESTLRREVKIKQDMRGLDYDIGYEVSGIAVTGDGNTITATCIEKEIDFQNLTVSSVLLEEPA